MLVLSRKPGQEIVIGGLIAIAVIEVRGEVVRLGITAPAELPVHRREVYERIEAERRPGRDEGRQERPAA